MTGCLMPEGWRRGAWLQACDQAEMLHMHAWHLMRPPTVRD